MKRIGVNAIPIARPGILRRNLLFFDEFLIDEFFLAQSGDIILKRLMQKHGLDAIQSSQSSLMADIDFLVKEKIARTTDFLHEIFVDFANPYPRLTEAPKPDAALLHPEVGDRLRKLPPETMRAFWGNLWNGEVPYTPGYKDLWSIDGSTIADEQEEPMHRVERRAKLLTMSKVLTGDENYYIPNLRGSIPTSQHRLLREREVLKLILKRLPVPHEDTPLKQILDFRQDPAIQQRLRAIRRWMQNIVSSTMSIGKVEEELTYQLHEYEERYRLLKVKYRYANQEILVTTPIKTLENILKGNPSSIAKNIFDIKNSKVDFLLEETKLPGRELAYITRTRERFFNKTTSD